jgi:hypothetical protein
MSSPIAFTDEQLDELFLLARPLSPGAREIFLEYLAVELAGRVAVGSGELHRIAVRIIRDRHLFEAPEGHTTERLPQSRAGISRWAKYR